MAVIHKIGSKIGPPDGYILMKAHGKKEVILYYQSDVEEIVAELSDKELSDPIFKTREFWQNFSCTCRHVLSLHPPLRKGLKKKKQMLPGYPLYELKKVSHCIGGCPIPGYKCKLVFEKYIGRICKCRP